MSRSDPPAAPYHALVVDDDRALQGLFTRLLSRKGFSVDAATDGRLACDHLNRYAYSVILLDLMMPDVNGFDLLKRLQREGPSPFPRGTAVAAAVRAPPRGAGG